MRDRIEPLILHNLIKNDSYTRKVLPFLQEEYFFEKVEKIIFLNIRNYINKYNSLPTYESILIDINNNLKLKETEYSEIVDYIQTKLNDTLFIKNTEEQWLLDQTEGWCKYQAIRNAIMASINIIDDPNSKFQREVIPKLLTDALSVGFSTNIGHDYIDDFSKRFEFYHTIEEKLEFDLELLNKITNGGLSKKTLNVVVAGTGVGKTTSICHFAASFLKNSKNILYITLEMSEEQIAKRIDANLLNISMLELDKIPKDDYEKRIDYLRNKSNGRLIIKEYPTASAHVGHFRSLLQELNLKKNFIPDVVIIDYLNICSSSRIKPGSVSNTYTYIKSIAEEIRGLAMEFNIPVLTASQLNRQGQHDSDVDFEGISDSHGTGMTADLIFALITNEDLDKMNQIMVKQIKNRNNDVSKYKRFIVGIDRNKMRLYNVEQCAQKNIVDSGQDLHEERNYEERRPASVGNRKIRKDYSKININTPVDEDLF